MAWRCYQLTYELQSPVHVGYHKVGNVQRTRYYLLARNLWDALTERLTRRGFDPDGVSAGDYGKIGRWVQEHCALTYFYILEGDRLTPRYVNGKLCYGDLPVPDFERRYLDSLATTALSPRAPVPRPGTCTKRSLSPHTRRMVVGRGIVPACGDGFLWAMGPVPSGRRSARPWRA